MDPAARREHWEDVWEGRGEGDASWHQEAPRRSLRLIASVGGPRARVVDVGGGDSRLVDHLLDAGYRDVTVLDVSEAALERAKRRLGDRAGAASWRVADITQGGVGGPYDVWHDRAVFHFLTDPGDRAAYRDALLHAVPPGGHAVIATFAPDGPEACSGLPVQRYDAEGLAAALGDGVALVASEREAHETPWGDVQMFQYALLRRQ